MSAYRNGIAPAGRKSVSVRAAVALLLVPGAAPLRAILGRYLRPKGSKVDPGGWVG